MFNIFMVDDDRIVLEGLKKFVDWEAMGFRVVGTALSAKEATEFIETKYVDVLLTDIVMSGRNGFELIRDAQMINPYIKTVVLSSYREFNYAKEAMRLGSFDYLSKPVNFDELKEIFTKLRSVLEKEIAERKTMLELQREHLRESAYSMADIGGEEVGPVIENVLRYINENYRKDITLQKLSEIAFVHPIYLSKLFKEKTGVNFIDYLTRVRIESSKKLLCNLSLRVYDVSEMVGYDSPKHFSKVFKEMTGLTPKEYRGRSHVLQQAGKVS